MRIEHLLKADDLPAMHAPDTGILRIERLARGGNGALRASNGDNDLARIQSIVQKSGNRCCAKGDATTRI